MKTLVIDDDPFALDMLGHQLRLHGLDPLVLCASAREAVALLGEPGAGFSLVFCDIQMPDVDGAALVRLIAGVGFAGGLVLVSGVDSRLMHSVRMLAEAHGVRVLGALHKPVALDELATVVALAALAPGARAASETAPVGPEELARAIAAGELLNHYQPKVELAGGKVVGAEALVRWLSPDGGMVPPQRFVGVAEEHGLIGELTLGVLRRALEQTRRWHEAGLAIGIAVNVSMDDLAALDFPDVVAEMAAESGVDLRALTLEVTESRLVKDLRAPLEILTRMRLKRIALAIDDFGTGHSSLAQLRDMPFDELKLDRSFVHGASRDAARRAIVSATLAMAKGLGILSVAEGVEDREDWALLRELGCDLAQGYLIAPPMAGDRLPGWCRDWDGKPAAPGAPG